MPTLPTPSPEAAVGSDSPPVSTAPLRGKEEDESPVTILPMEVQEKEAFVDNAVTLPTPPGAVLGSDSPPDPSALCGEEGPIPSSCLSLEEASPSPSATSDVEKSALPLLSQGRQF